MRKSRRRHVIPLAVFALVAAAAIAGGLSLVAHAQTEITSCKSGTTTPIECTITSGGATSTTVPFPSSIQAVVTLTPSSTSTATPSSTSTATPSGLYAVITYSVTCQSGDASSTTNQSTNGASDDFAFGSGTSVTDTLTLGYGHPANCTVNSLEAELEVLPSGDTSTADLTPATTGQLSMELEWTPQPSDTTSSSASSSSVNVTVAKGYDGKCMDDRGNSSANRAAVIIWSCNSGDSAQGFTYSGGELKHNGKCVNDQGNGGSGTHLILWTCNGAANEKWFHSGSDGEFLLSSQAHGLLCIDDPGNSKTNGTRLIIWKCHNTSNQHWT